MTSPVDDAARILDRARDETPDVLDAIIAETRDYQPSQAMERLNELAEYPRLSGRQRVEHALLSERVQTAARALGAFRSGSVGDLAGMFDQSRGPGNPAPGRTGRPAPAGPYFDRAARVLGALHDRGLPDHAAVVADRLLRNPQGVPEGGAETARDLAARWVSVCGSPEYERAWAAVVRDPVAGGAELDEGERAAWRAGRQIQNALGEGGSGQYLVPIFIDPTIQLSNAGSNNSLRQVCRVEQIVTSAWHGVASAGATSEWVAEGAVVADASPVLTQPVVPVYKADSFVPFSFELEGDADGLMQQLARVLVDAYDLLRNVAYTTGSGTGQPSGVIPGITQLTQSPIGAFVASHVTQAQNALPPRFSANASWLGNIAVLNTIALFQTANGSLVYPEVRNTPSTLLRKPLAELSDMTSDMSTTGKQYLAYGSWRDAFLIVDRIGASIELVPHLFQQAVAGTGVGMPTGQRGALLWARTGSAVLIPNAARVLVKA